MKQKNTEKSVLMQFSGQCFDDLSRVDAVLDYVDQCEEVDVGDATVYLCKEGNGLYAVVDRGGSVCVRRLYR